MIDDDVLYKSVDELSRLIGAREISPVELTRSYLSRIDTLDPELHAFVTRTPELALAQARQAEKEIMSGQRRGPLHGIPYGTKDLLSTKGIPTTWGAKPFAGRIIDEDAEVVRRLREAGAILLGKAAMIELAGGLGYSKGDASLTGATRNPWDYGRWTCGSSSGSSAAVAAALLPFAIGSETWGSIVCPASFCGISGLRPTFGRVSRRGSMVISWTFDKLGPMARSAIDCATVLRAIEGHDPDDPFSADEPPTPKVDPARGKRMKVGFIQLNFKKYGDPDVERVFNKALADLEAAGVAIDEVPLPDLPFESLTWVILVAEAATAFEELEKSGDVRRLVTEEAPLSFITSRAMRASDVVKARRIQTICQRAMADILGTYDVLLYPGEMHTAFPIDKDFSEIAWADPMGAAGNLCGLPGLSVPCGFAPDGLPVSLTAVTGAFREADAIALTRFYQGITDWHTKRPPLARLS
ncbi:MAG: amidase [Acidobacteria bacterium]|nr:amidase [Acidobacteriota bacterium]